MKVIRNKLNEKKLVEIIVLTVRADSVVGTQRRSQVMMNGLS